MDPANTTDSLFRDYKPGLPVFTIRFLSVFFMFAVNVLDFAYFNLYIVN